MKTIFKLVHIGQDYVGINRITGKTKTEYLELPLVVAEMFFGELSIDDEEIDIPKLKKYIDNNFNLD